MLCWLAFTKCRMG